MDLIMRQVPHYVVIGSGRLATHMCHYYDGLTIRYDQNTFTNRSYFITFCFSDTPSLKYTCQYSQKIVVAAQPLIFHFILITLSEETLNPKLINLHEGVKS